MRIKLLALVLFFSSVHPTLGQLKSYYNQTELGVLFGNKVDTWYEENGNRVDFSLITFHGARVSKHHVVGFSLGFDQYEEISIVPIALGWRGFLGKETHPQLIGGIDFGGGSAFLEKKEETEWYESWYKGGLMFSPSVGVKFPAKNGKTSLTMTVAYKRQELGLFQGNFELNPGPRPSRSSSLPEEYNSVTETSFLFHSLVGRIGFIF